MRGLARTHLPARQRGAALLILLALVSMAVMFALVTGLNRSAGDLARARDQKTYAALAQAKEALIAYAVMYKDTHDDPINSKYYVPGYLPCPDLGSPFLGEGVAAGSCPQSGPSSLVSVMGRLPWKTLGLDALKDGSGECLWYAVSGTYKNNPNGVSGSTTTSNMMNWDTNGQFAVVDSNGNTLAGSSADNQAVAVIFAPGSALIPAGASTTQDRTPVSGTTACGGNYNPAAYMETAKDINNSVINNSTLVTPSSPGSVSDVSKFIARTGSDTFNDKLVYITRADIWNAIKKRSDFNNYLRAMTRLAAECTAMYGQQNNHGYPNDMRLPWASKVSLSGTSVPIYAVNSRYNDASGVSSGRLSYLVYTSRSATGNQIVSNSEFSSSGYYLFFPGSYSPPDACPYTNDQKIWYNNWKDQLFYAVANNYNPSAADSPMAGCPTCLNINSADNYAAVVIFAGDKLSGQSRNIATDKGAIANYLEGSNPASITANTGGGNYQAAVASSTFNDIVYAIDINLAVKCFSSGSNTMVPVPPASVAPPGDLTNYARCP